jgi:hypothetical protein
VAGQDALSSLRESVADFKTTINGQSDLLTEYSDGITGMKAVVNTANAAGDCADPFFTNLIDALNEIKTGIDAINLPVDTSTLDPLEEMLVQYKIPPDFDEIIAFKKTFLTFALDALFAVIAAWTLLLGFFACFANCNFKMSKSGLCACLHWIYKYLVLVLGSIFLTLNLAICGISIIMAMMFSDMCSVEGGPGEGLKLLTTDLNVEFPDDSDFFWWTKCDGAHPLQSELDAFGTPIQELYDLYSDGTTIPADECGTAAPDPLGAIINKALVTDGQYTATLWKTNWDFAENFHCTAINGAYTKLMHDGVCTHLTTTFFWLGAALFGSTFILIISFWILACVSRKIEGDDEEEEEEDDASASGKGKK